MTIDAYNGRLSIKIHQKLSLLIPAFPNGASNVRTVPSQVNQSRQRLHCVKRSLDSAPVELCLFQTGLGLLPFGRLSGPNHNHAPLGRLVQLADRLLV